MRCILGIVTIVWMGAITGVSQVEDPVSYLSEIIEFREDLNEHYRNKDYSPLNEAERLKFKEHRFFDIDKKYCVVARLDMSQANKKVEFKTQTGRKPNYRIYGKAVFTLDGKEHALNIYRNDKTVKSNPRSVYGFIPFNDLTNGVETYGGGRYIDVKLDLDSDTVIIDFNTSYHPYCAYTDGYSCPVPPRENILDVIIPAGIRL